MFIIKHRKIFYTIAIMLVATSITFLAIWSLNFGIDFTGGTLWEMDFKNNRPISADITQALSSEGLEPSTVQPAGENGYILRFRPLDEGQHQQGLSVLEDKFGEIDELSFEAVGPSIGKELRDKSLYAIVIVILAIIAYIAWSFRKVEKVVSSWVYGAIAIVALVHDVLIPLGIFAFLGKFFGLEITSAFVAAILTVLGYSVNDTIVVFDRVRENLRKHTHDDFVELVGASIKQTISRSINTSLTTTLVLGAIYFFGGESIKPFALVLMIGIGAGTYSSIFLASPLLVSWSLKKAK
ncbi:MAG: protein translocase subunit SecF [Parcubacteria group bacterium CG10_big_fil_rev_8_21_14_0_10_36_14]|nr:MAG: protein translocase subunit SecF [Parcubacteria group bacterium CG10_big_fil_rev_8_21_14_0_10_36_14]